MVGPEGLPQANNANALYWRTGQYPPVEGKRVSSGLANLHGPPDRETAAQAGPWRDGFLHSLTARFYTLRVIRARALDGVQ